MEDLDKNGLKQSEKSKIYQPKNLKIFSTY